MLRRWVRFSGNVKRVGGRHRPTSGSRRIAVLWQGRSLSQTFSKIFGFSERFSVFREKVRHFTKQSHEESLIGGCRSETSPSFRPDVGKVLAEQVFLSTETSPEFSRLTFKEDSTSSPSTSSPTSSSSSTSRKK